MKYHGNYCGPWWSAGKAQSSVLDPNVPAIDEFDETCRVHDAHYANDDDLYDADVEFIASNVRQGPKRALAALAVMPQLAMRSLSRAVEYNMTKSKSNKQNLRGSKMVPTAKTKNDSVIRAPVAVATARTSTAPTMQNTNSGVVKIKHRAFIQPVSSNSSFTAFKLPCNPGLSGSFPWLAQLARKYDMYRFTSLKYSYRSVAATSTPGVVMLSFDYDAADDIPTNKAKQAQTVPSIECNSWTSLDLVVPLDGVWKFVRPGVLPSNLDIKTYDTGNLVVSSIYGSNIVTGELYVEYSVELKKPSDGSDDTGTLTFVPPAFSTPFPPPAVVTGFVPLVRLSNTTLQFVTSGEYLINASTTGTGLTAAAAIPTISTSGSGVVADIFNIVTATATVRLFKVRGENGDVLTFANAGTGTTIVGLFVRISVVDYDTMQ